MPSQSLLADHPFKPLMIRVGDFFFKWRNQAFPVLLVAIYLFAPPSGVLAGRESLEPFRDALALGFVAAGLALRATVVGYAYIKRGGVDKKVYAADLVTAGLFGVCRNPLYVGNLLIVLGVLTMHGDGWVFLAGCLLMAFVYQSIVYAEEHYLEAKFGAGYRDYCRDVPRWGFRLSRLSAATEGMRFDLRKAILAEYTTIATSLSILAATELYEQLGHHDDPPSMPVVWGMVGFIATAILWTMAFRFYKKRRARRLAAATST